MKRRVFFLLSLLLLTACGGKDRTFTGEPSDVHDPVGPENVTVGGQEGYDDLTEVYLCDAFDRETGEHIDGWELYSCPAEETKRTLLDFTHTTEPTLRAEMESALRPEYVRLYADGLEICFPQGTLPSQDTALGFGGAMTARFCPFSRTGRCRIEFRQENLSNRLTSFLGNAILQYDK